MNRIDSGLFTVKDFRSRGVIKLGPDALVYLSGSLGDAVVVPVASGNQKVDFNDGITSVNVQNNIDPPGSSNASIEIVTPIYGENSRYWLTFDDPETGRSHRIPMFQPMTEVKIFFKGRYLVQNGGKVTPKYYPAFWGFITNVEENYSGGMWKINLSCADMLHWWSYSQVNIHPVVESEIAAGESLNLTHYSTIYEDANPYSIIYTLTQDMGMHEMVVPTFVGELTPLSQQYPPQALRNLMQGQVMEYWRKRFKYIASFLKMYGMNGREIEVSGPNGKNIKTKRPDTQRTNRQRGTSDSKDASYSRIRGDFEIDNEYLKYFQVFFDFEKMGTFDDAEYMSKLEVATQVKSRVDFEFFQDVNGDWIFKPPFYNLNTKNLYPYAIKSNEIISNSFNLDSEGLLTVLEVSLPIHPNLRVEGSAPAYKGFHVDAQLAATYGIRYQRQHLEYLVYNNSNAGNQIAVAMMSLNNSKAFTGSVTIPGRPEMRLGYPVYIEHRDSFHYVKSINHSFDYGGSFTTTLSLEAERKKVYDFQDGRWVGPLKDYVNKYQGPAEIGELTYSQDQGPESKNEFLEQARKIQEQTGKLSSLKQGRYKLEKRDPGDEAQMAVTNVTVPVTDEEGYRVIGGFRYGRGILVSGNTIMDTADTVPITDPERLKNERQNDSLINMEVGANREASEMGRLLRNTNKQEGVMHRPLEFFRIDGGEGDGDSDESPFVNDTKAEKDAEKSVDNRPSNFQGPQEDQKKTLSGAVNGAAHQPGQKTRDELQRQNRL